MSASTLPRPEVRATSRLKLIDCDIHPAPRDMAVLDRYLPVIADLRMRHLDDHEWTGDIVVVSHGAAIRLVAATLAGVEASFALEHHLSNAQCVVLAPITDGRWSCLHWGAATPPFYPEPDANPVEDAKRAPDPMG